MATFLRFRPGAADDSSTLRQLREGDPEAVERVRGWIRAAAARYRDVLGEDLQDLEQDALVGLLEAVRDETFRGASRLHTYVHAYAHHKCIDRLRQAKRRPTVDVLELELPAPEASPLDRLAQRDKERLLRQVLDEMPADCRQAWELLLAGASYREMSRKLGVSEGSLRVRVLRCRRRALAARKALLEQAAGPDRK